MTVSAGVLTLAGLCVRQWRHWQHRAATSSGHGFRGAIAAVALGLMSENGLL